MPDPVADVLTSQSWDGPAIILVDLDAFFASVEQLDHPEWRGKPVIVGGDPDKHGVVSTCSYEARAFGVHSAMPASTAQRLCPEAIWTHGHFDRYRQISRAIMDIIRNETPHVQQVSIDEAFADITPTRANREHPALVAKRIQERVQELGVTCSIGVGTTKSVAKIASDMDKPQGLTVVYPGSESTFLADLPIRCMSGVGKVAEERLLGCGIRTLGQMAQADERVLVKVFGKNAQMMRERAAGGDVSAVNPTREVKSVSHETTFAEDLTKRVDVEAALTSLLLQVGRRLRRKGLKGRTLMLKVRFDDRALRTAQCQLPAPSDDDLAMAPLLPMLLDKVWCPGMKVRLLGVAVSGFDTDKDPQARLFDLEEEADLGQPLVKDEEKRRGLLNATDALKERFGEDAVIFGSQMRNRGNTTGSSSKHPADYQ